MTETDLARRKRLLHQSRYRGMLEGDLLIGRFAERHLGAMSDVQLERFARLLDENDADLLAWASGQRHVPARHDNDVMRLLRRFADAGLT